MEFLYSGILVTTTPKLTLFSSKTGAKMWKCQERILRPKDFANRAVVTSVTTGSLVTLQENRISWYLLSHPVGLLKWRTCVLNSWAPDAFITHLLGDAVLITSKSQNRFQIYSSDGKLCHDEYGKFQYHRIDMSASELRRFTISTTEGQFRGHKLEYFRQTLFSVGYTKW